MHATDSFSVRVADLSLIGTVMTPAARAAAHRRWPASPSSRTDDLSAGSEALPPTDGLRYYLEDDSRIIVRPSGTEPKLKVYLEVIEPVSSDLRHGPRGCGEPADRDPYAPWRSSPPSDPGPSQAGLTGRVTSGSAGRAGHPWGHLCATSSRPMTTADRMPAPSRLAKRSTSWSKAALL